MVGWTEVEKVDHTHHFATLAMLHHEAQLFVCVNIVSVSLNILMQQIPRIGNLTSRHKPQASIILDMKHEIEICELGCTQK